MIFDASDPLSKVFRDAIGQMLTEVLAVRRAEIVDLDAALAPLIDLMVPLAVGGKHIRPAFVWWGHVAVAGEPADPRPLRQLASSLDLIHAGLLAHDDLIDASDTRRGRPSLHVAAAALADPANEALGVAAAIFGGVLLMQWGEQLAEQSGLLRPAARAAFDDLRNRVLAGQLADTWASAGCKLMGPPGSGGPLSHAKTVAVIDDLKTASYTVVGPTRLGALAGDADERQLDALLRFAAPVGRAFQSRDDVLGVFGDESRTGKPTGNDLRQGKVTSLVEAALKLADPSGAAALRAVLGDTRATDVDVARARDIIASCGALAVVEHAIADDVSDALEALDEAELRPVGRAGLAALANAAAQRDR